MNNDHSCLKIAVKPTDFRLGDGRLKLGGITTQNWLAHFDFFVSQMVSGQDTDDCWSFGGTKNLDAFMDALILDGLLPAAVVQQITDWGFMDTGMDGKQHFHSSERFAAILSGFGQNGGNLNSAYDIIRKYGCVPFKFLPVTPNMTIADYFSPVPPHLLDIGKEFLALMGGKDFCQYQWLNDGGTTDIPAMSVAIADGPLLLGIPVNTGWNQVHPTVATGTPEHVVSCYSVPVPSADISDNYNPYLKVLDPGYQISYVIQLIVQYIPPPPAPTPPAPSYPNDPTPAQEVQWYDWLIKVAQWLGLIE